MTKPRFVLALAVFLGYSACSAAPGGDSKMPAKLLDSLYISGYGSAAASGTVQFYSVGTLTPAVVYSDDALTQAVTQPITLDAQGRTPLPIYTATPLRAIIKNVQSATLQDISRIDGDRAELIGISNSATTATDLNSLITLAQTSLGGTDFTYLNASPGAVARSIQSKFSEVQVSVKDFGAKCNGIADDTTAIQSAINSVQSSGGGTVFFPAGTCLTSAALSVTVAGVSLVGVNRTAAIIKLTNATANAVTMTGVSVVIRNLQFTHSSSTTGAAIRLGAGNSLIENVQTSIGYASGVTGGAGVILNSTLFNSAASTAGALNMTTGSWLVIGGSIIGGAASSGALVGAGASAAIYGSQLGGSVAALDVATSSGTVYFTNGSVIASPIGIRVAAGAGIAYNKDVDFSGATTPITDSRVSSPVNYSFGINNSVTPLPTQSEAIRVVATAAITVTVNAVAATGFGKKFSLYCSNASGGAVTWTFDPQYVLSGAVNPANGNRVNLLLEYNPVDNKVYELSRAATAN